jgi:hypothetical protein
VSKPTCAGPVYFADQGIEACETCGGCTCCDFEHIDHSAATYRCAFLADGTCWIVGSKLKHTCEPLKEPRRGV